MITRVLAVVAISLLPTLALAAPTPTVVPLGFSAASVPRGVTVKGTIVGGAHWSDKAGEQWLVVTEVAPHAGTPDRDNPDMTPMSAEVYAYDFVTDGTTFQQVWMTQDFVKDCELDMACNNVPGSVRVTDLDNDGEAETAFIYRLACRGDPSPSTQKLLMHEGVAKYALRGTSKVVIEGIPPDGGTYTADPAFSSAPPTFLAAAAALWQTYLIEGQ